MVRSAPHLSVLITLSALVLLGCGGEAEVDAGAAPSEEDSSRLALVEIPIDTVVARVYDTDIHGGELMDLFTTQLGLLGTHLTRGAVKADSPPEVLAQAQAQFLETSRFFLVAMHLMAHEAREADLVFDEQKLQERFLDRQRKFPSDLEFRNHLARFGFTPETLRQRIVTELLAEAWREKTIGEVTISDADLKATYDANREQFEHPDTVWISHVARIFGLGAAEATKASEREMIEKAKAELDQGVSFEDVARSYSTAPSAARGGRMYGPDVPPMMKGRLDPDLVPTVIEEVAFRLGEGETSGILETQDAYHILRVDQRRDAGTRPFDEVKKDLREEFVARQTRVLVDREIQRLWEGAEAEGVLQMPSLQEHLPPPPQAADAVGDQPAAPPAEG
jgi:peptidyl-prolyl cis-trans isomerase C